MKSLRSLEILDFLKTRRHCSMAELMERFQVSPATIHRDITELTRKNLIRKVHGGVAALPDEAENEQVFRPEAHFRARIVRETEKKSAIAAQALPLIEDGDIIFLDSSTTVLHLARLIQGLNLPSLTLVTNSIHIMQEFCLFPPHFMLVGLGGNYNSQLNSLLGGSALEGIARLRVGRAFVSAVGAAGGAVTTYHEEHANFLRLVLERAARRYLLLDSTKTERAGLFRFAEIADFDRVFCDK